MKRMLTLMLLCLLVTPVISPGQSWQTKSLTEEDGLSHGYVSALFQDSRGFVWIGTLYGLNRFDGYKIKSYIPNQLDPHALHGSIITKMAEDKNGMLWIGTDNGIVVFNPFSERFTHLLTLDTLAPAGTIRELFVDDHNNIWCYQLSSGTHTVYQIHNNPAIPAFLAQNSLPKPGIKIQKIPLPKSLGTQIRVMIPTDNQTCLLANAEGKFFNLNLENKSFTTVAKPGTTILSGKGNKTLLFPNHDFSNPLRPEERLRILPSANGKEILCQFFETNVYELSPDNYPLQNEELSRLKVIATLDQPMSIASLADKSGKIWQGTIGSGVRILEPATQGFQHRFAGINIFNPSLMHDGRIWAGMYAPDKVLDLSTGQISNPIWAKALPPGYSVNAALCDENSRTVFLITSNQQQLQLQKMDVASGKLQLIEKLSLFTVHPVILKKDRKGHLWVAGQGAEIIRYQPSSGKIDHWQLDYLFTNKTNPSRQAPRNIAEDYHGNIWICSDAGLTKISFSENGKVGFKAFHNYGEKGPVFKSSWIFSIHPDPQNKDILWLGTMSGGLAKFHIQKETVDYVTTKQNPGFDLVSGIVPDDAGNMWLSTNKGIFKYMLSTNIFVDYSQLRNVPKIDLNAAAMLKTSSGEILMGGNQGFIAIQPEKIIQQAPDGELFLTQVEINRQPTDKGIQNHKIRIDSQNTYSLHLNHDDFFVSLGFSIPSIGDPATMLYRYRLRGLLEEWVYLGQSHYIELTGLSPGNYTLEIQAIHSSSSWAKAKSLTVPIHVSPPWYAGKLAFALYALLLIILIRLGFVYQQKRLALQYQAELSQKEMERLQSMDDFKNRFFAYIAHEFKTPLTIIMGAGEQLKGILPTNISRDYPDAITREGRHMLNLIHEMIDVTKLQDKSLQPHYENRDIVSWLENIVEAHKPVTELHQIQLLAQTEVPALVMDFDPLRLQYILDNLISNAIRHTPTHGKIKVALEPAEPGLVSVSVSDSGSGIPSEDLDLIFEKYYRGNGSGHPKNHFGLGLSFVRELTTLLKGTISVNSEPGKGTRFSLILPLKAPAGIPVAPGNDTLAEPEGLLYFTDAETAPDAPNLLIAEDNPAIVAFLRSILQPHFRLSFAKNGREGLDLAIKEIPDLILTDVMMPIMDGMEMTHQLKNHELTSHIPVVILSAKNEISDRIKGQQTGADAYIGKPFNAQELLLTLQNLHLLQKKWKTRYASVTDGHPDMNALAEMPSHFEHAAIAKTDAFMQSILDAFEKHYASEKFDAPELAGLLNISKAQLYKKVAKISDEGVMGLLRNFRLQKSIEIMEQHPELSTKEVAFSVGFKEYSHFSNCFKKHFGISPSEWRKSNVKVFGG